MKRIVLVILLAVVPFFTQAQEDTLLLKKYELILNGDDRQPDPAFARLAHHYLKRMKTFESEPMIGYDDIVMLGNSLTEGGRNWGEKLPSVARRIVNRGIVGDTTSGILMRLSDITSHQPVQIFLLIGVNDLQVAREPEEILQNLEEIIRRIKKETPGTELIVQTLLPIDESTGQYKFLQGKAHKIGEINLGLKGLAEKHGVRLLDLYPHFLDTDTNALRKEISGDGLHLKPEGYKIWATLLEPLMKK